MALASAALAGGCGDDDEEREREPTPVRVAEQGFSQVGRSVLVGAVLRNDGREAAEGVEVRFEVRDGDGQVIGAATENLVVIPAGEGFNVGAQIELDDERARAADVGIDVEGWVEDTFAGDDAPAEVPRVTAPNLLTTPDGMIVTADVEAPPGVSLSSIADVYAVLRDRDGEIVGGLTSAGLERDTRPGAPATALLATEASLRGVADADVSVDAETD